MKTITVILMLALSTGVCWGEVEIDHNSFNVEGTFECPDGRDMKITVTGESSVHIRCVEKPGGGTFDWYCTTLTETADVSDLNLTTAGECVEYETDEHGNLTGNVNGVPCDEGTQ